MSTTHDVTDGRDASTGVDAAVTALQRGELVVLPTDTVYGIACDAFSPSAVQRLLSAKGRGRERALVYKTLVTTGLRRNELISVRLHHLDLDAFFGGGEVNLAHEG